MAYEGQPARAFVDLALVQDHLTQAERYVADTAAGSYRHGTEGCMRSLPSLQFDSPLEALFWLWWSACLYSDRHLDDTFDLQSQAEVVLPNGSRYRVDFLISPVEARIAGSPEWLPIAVELDGHAFHERTPEQVAIRDRRDRDLQQAGWKVFHFSFREFTEQPIDCLAEVIVFARKQWNYVSVRDYLRTHKETDPGLVAAAKV